MTKIHVSLNPMTLVNGMEGIMTQTLSQEKIDRGRPPICSEYQNLQKIFRASVVSHFRWVRMTVKVKLCLPLKPNII